MPKIDLPSLWKRAWNPSRFVVGLFILLAVTLNIAVPPLFNWLESTLGDENLYPALLGIVCGEFCSVVLLSGLTCRTWMRGFLYGLALAFLWYLALFVGFWFSEEFSIPSIDTACLFPWHLLIASAPLIALRHCGWRLVHNKEVVEPLPPFRIADLLHWTAIVAATLTLLRVPAVMSETELADYWPPILIFSGIFFAFGLLVLPFAAWLAFGISSRAKSVCGLGVLVAIAYAVLVLISQCSFDWNATWNSRAEVLLPIANAVGVCVAVLYTFMFFYSVTGMVLIRVRPHARATPQVDESNQGMVSPSGRFLTRGRWQTALAIVVAAVVSIGLAGLQSWRQAKDQEIAKLVKIAEKLGGRVRSSDRKVTWVKLGQPATDADFEQFLSCRSLEVIELDSKNMTDSTLERISRFELLKCLLLKDSTITDQGLRYLSNLKGITKLDLINTPITGAGLVPLADSLPITSLDLDRSRFTDTNCAILCRFPHLQNLSLSGTAVTDEGLRQLEQIATMQSLELNDTAVDGTGLQECRQIRFLFLDRTYVHDESILSLASLSNLGVLSIADTRITDQAIDYLVRLPTLFNLDISRTKVSEAGVARLASLVNLQFVTLSGTAITGECFRQWPRAQLKYLDLSNTLVTDATLPLIAKLGLQRLSIHGTKVTSTGILGAGFIGLGRLDVAPGQFSEAEIAQLKRGLVAEVVESNEVLKAK